MNAARLIRCLIKRQLELARVIEKLNSKCRSVALIWLLYSCATNQSKRTRPEPKAQVHGHWQSAISKAPRQAAPLIRLGPAPGSYSNGASAHRHGLKARALVIISPLADYNGNNKSIIDF